MFPPFLGNFYRALLCGDVLRIVQNDASGRIFDLPLSEGRLHSFGTDENFLGIVVFGWLSSSCVDN